MAFSEIVAWSVVVGLSLLSVGGLVLWAYGTRNNQNFQASLGMEAEATRHFHLHLVRWFFIYGISVMIVGAGLLLWSGSVFLK
jgi:hypothetical protein